MKSDNIDKEYDSEKAKLETEFAEKLADLKEKRVKAKAMISDKKLNLRLATDLWTKGKSRMEIAQILEVPNDAVLSLMIRGHYKDSVESHTRTGYNEFAQGGELYQTHETYPCPACYPNQQGLSRKEEDDDWKIWINRVRKNQARRGTFDEANQLAQQKREAMKGESIVIVGKNDTFKYKDVTNAALRTKNESQQERLLARYQTVDTSDIPQKGITALQNEQKRSLNFVRENQGKQLTDKSNPTITAYRNMQKRLNAITHELRKRYKGSKGSSN